MATGSLIYKVSVKPKMKWVFVAESLLHFNWLIYKCLTMELVFERCASLEASQ
ncbi:Uncharacterised protein [Leminorella grimontii]|nr:Uncharacterised protein [Leminorella grimontii]